MIINKVSNGENCVRGCGFMSYEDSFEYESENIEIENNSSGSIESEMFFVNEKPEQQIADKQLFWKKEEIPTNPELLEMFHEMKIENVDLTGVKDIWQFKIAKATAEMYENYPELQGFIGSISTAKLPDRVYACAGPRFTKDGFSTQVLLSKDYFSKNNLEWNLADQEVANFRGEKWSAANGVEGILKHETAHLLHLKMLAEKEGLNVGEFDREKYRNVIEQFQHNEIVTDICFQSMKELNLDKSGLARELSIYGCKDFGECFAEAISEYETSDKPRRFATLVHEKYIAYNTNNAENIESVRQKKKIVEGVNKIMMVIPPKELIKYISIDESGQFIHSSDMPTELKEKYDMFINDVRQAEKFSKIMSNEE